MNPLCKTTNGSAKILLILSILLTAILSTSARASSQSDPLIQELRQWTGDNIQVSYHPGTGKVRSLRASSGAAIRQPFAIARDATPEIAARSFLRRYGILFGITDPLKELTVKRERKADRGRSFVRFQQVHQGIPVIGGELIVQMDSAKNILSVNGEISPAPAVNTTPVFPPGAARDKALEIVGTLYQVDTTLLNASEPELWIYNPVLLGREPNTNTLVWRMEVKTTETRPVRELVLVDASSGNIVLHFNQIDSALKRKIYDHANIAYKPLPGDPADLKRSEDEDPSGITDVDLAYDFAGDTYNFYYNYHGRDSLDNAGMDLISTTRYCPDDIFNCPYQNAFWNGSQMVYGEGFASADDVVAHEMTHGVTEHESNLFYYNQSGAINESFSDIWGEFVDLTNGRGNDDISVRWLMGEDLPPEIGAIRDMSDPTVFGDPDRMHSPNYWNHECDNGGVHINSGIGNKVAYLMTDGGSFNGVTVTGLGITKVAKIFYEAQTNLLTSASDYNDLAEALQQACTNLIGTDGITAPNCQEVANAITATEMNQTPPTNILKNPGFEDGNANWTEYTFGGYAVILVFPYFGACSSNGLAWFGGYDNAEDYIYQNVTIPSNAIQASLRFIYAIYTDEVDSAAYDTMKVEVWNSSGTILLATLDTLSNVDDTFGEWFFSAKYDLTSFEGQDIRLRFYVTTNDSNPSDFFLDDIVLSAIALPETISTPDPPSGPTDGIILTSYPFTTGGSSSDFGDPVQYLFDWGDGTTSGWLAVGVTGASKSWNNPGTYQVKVQARCATHTDVLSSWSQELSIDIVPIAISLQSPDDGFTFDSCALISNYQPSFQWTSNGPLTKYTILISTSSTDFTTRGVVLSKATVSGTINSWKPSSFAWKKIIQSSYNLGAIRDIYWKVVGTKSDGTTTVSEVRSFRIGNPQIVTINSPGEGETLFSSVPPTFDFSTNCNKKFTLEFSPLSDFSDPRKIKGVTLSIKDPNAQTAVQKTLSSFQWKGIVKLLGTGGYFRIKAWDGLNRQTVSDPRSFSID
jgi:Zn-dependent metalloprotease